MEFSTPSLIFWLIFVVPMVAGLGWIMWQDKRRRKSGLVILIAMVVIAIVYMYVRTKGM
jgi:glucan phosphoethanolaminetransferase (alkaline phosphatase superfamily)